MASIERQRIPRGSSGAPLRVMVTGSIATDHLMRFPGKFVESIVPEQLSTVSLSFLADELQIRRGGVGPNICFGLGVLGLHPVLVGAAGADFEEYGFWLERHGVDIGGVHITSEHHTARFVCTTDSDNNQIATFYAGAMAEARNIELEPLVLQHGGIDLVVIGANDPDAMLRHTDECRYRRYPFAADPSQQLARMAGPEIRRLIHGAAVLFSNEYESALIEQKTGWAAEEVLEQVGIKVTTLGAKGARVERLGEPAIEVRVPQERAKADPTGVGDAFRAGFLAGMSWGVDLQRAAEIGAMLATLVVETVGTQEYDIVTGRFLPRFEQCYGAAAAREIEPHLPAAVG